MLGLSSENSPPADILLNEGDEIAFGNLTFKVMHTPGHSRGGVCFFTQGHVFVGDTLFAGSIGRTDLPGGNHNLLIQMIRQKIMVLPDNVVVYPGHGPHTTVGTERSSNPFLIGSGYA